jgi:hypothetical protein
MTPSRTRFGLFIAAAPLVIGTVLASAAPVQAKMIYDGSWSVVIVTEKGECDRAYRYPINISGGKLINAGSAMFDISGKVASNGAISVRVSYGERSAMGVGRMNSRYGTGSWRGGSCAGTWTAERRG